MVAKTGDLPWHNPKKNTPNPKNPSRKEQQKIRKSPILGVVVPYGRTSWLKKKMGGDPNYL